MSNTEEESASVLRADAVTMAKAILEYVHWDEDEHGPCRYCGELEKHTNACVVLIARIYTRRPAF